MKTTYFHICPVLLGEGSIINPGNFGRVIELYVPHNINVVAIRELAFEVVRLKQFPDKPSRINSLFLFSTLEMAISKINQFDRTSIAYEVELIHKKPKIFKGDMNLIRSTFPNQEVPAIPFLMDIATMYWSGQNLKSGTTELLTNSPCKVLRTIDPKIIMQDVAELLKKQTGKV